MLDDELSCVDGRYVDHEYNKGKGTYSLNSECVNCRKRYIIRRVRGYRTSQDGPECPNCGCDIWMTLTVQAP